MCRGDISHIGGVHRWRLLAEDILARFERLDDHVFDQKIRGADDHRVDGLIAYDRLRVRGDRIFHLFGQGHIKDTGDLTAHFFKCFRSELAHFAKPDDADPDHVVLLKFCYLSPKGEACCQTVRSTIASITFSTGSQTLRCINRAISAAPRV